MYKAFGQEDLQAQVDFLEWVEVRGINGGLYYLSVQTMSIAIVMIDICGYSRLIDRDALGTARRVLQLRHQILEPFARAHRGTVVDSSGDNTMLAFHRADDALGCAFAVQQVHDHSDRAMAARDLLQLHIGISAGQVLLIDGSFYGRPVNIAARLAALTEPNAIYLCEATLDQIDPHIVMQAESLGEQLLRNMEPVQAYRLTGTWASRAVASRMICRD
ncbi:MAG TPA: adenylate/guanylate cyclase domain-containing protein [Geminicoccus sp.]|jgi:class 3 adenylate cyclase|uniref:adenylate/guanylate cyclase domain-containing protein n=1 Tax=Geminicoccus sp. TaxID=2024832 RepID=UPI002E3766B9|nr:adenylate/guanylate cyclase domain-containing protein [Geminicoccus sp.]HEX2525175.1 adenylate/guanylate cyclase domain-containing protein [Geminicoccus sp.]